jgi:hypothetical protein
MFVNTLQCVTSQNTAPFNFQMIRITTVGERFTVASAFRGYKRLALKEDTESSMDYS